MSAEEACASGKCSQLEAESPMEETEVAKQSDVSAAEVVEMVDSLLGDGGNISLGMVIASKNKLIRDRQNLIEKTLQLKREANGILKRQEEVLKNSRHMCDQVAKSIGSRSLMSEKDLEQLNEVLQATSKDGRRAIYFITHWLVKRLDEKLEKLFALTSISLQQKVAHSSNNGQAIWDDRVALGTYLEMLDIALNIQSSACQNLVVAVTNTVEYWFKKLLDRFSKDFASKLEVIHYPFSAAMQPIPKNFTKSPLPLELQSLVENVQILLELRPPPGWKSPLSNNSFQTTFAAPFLTRESDPEKFGHFLISELISPLLRRFHFHFYGKRPTNSPDHPEWYHTQILSWLESNSSFVKALFTDACNSFEDMSSQRRHDSVELLYNSWASAIARFAVEKLSIDLPALLNSDTIFAHLVDETLLFRNSMFTLLTKNDATTVEMDPIRLLITPAVFDRWLDVEKRFALARIDAFLSKPDALTIPQKIISEAPLSKDIAIAPTCVVDFVSLVSGLLDRCDIIMSAYTLHKDADENGAPAFCAFLSMVLGLVDGFRIRLLQLGRSFDSLSSRGLAILAAAGHLEDAIMVDWMHRPVVVASQTVPNNHVISVPSSPPKNNDLAELAFNMISSSNTTSSALNFSDEGSLFARAVRELADQVVGALEMELIKACTCAAEDYESGETSGVELPEEHSSHVALTVAHCAAIALHNLLDRLRLGLGGSPALRRLVGSKIANRVDSVLYSQIFERVAARKTVLAPFIAKQLDEFVRTRIVCLLARHLVTSATTPAPERLLPRVIDSLNLLYSVQEPVARLLRSTLTTPDISSSEISTSLEEIGCRVFAKNPEKGAKSAILILNVRFGASA